MTIQIYAIPFVLVAGLGWQVRSWALACPRWYGAFVQAALTSVYGVLCFCFLHGSIGILWEWWLWPMHYPELEQAYHLGFVWLPYLYVLGVVGVFVVLIRGARLRRGFQKLVHVAFGLGLLIAIYYFQHYVEWELSFLAEEIQIAQEEQAKTGR